MEWEEDLANPGETVKLKIKTFDRYIITGCYSKNKKRNHSWENIFMEKRKLTIFNIFILSSFSIYAEMIKEGFLISGIKIDEAYKNEILLEEESYKIDESSFYNCVYKLQNTNNKNSNVSFSINVKTAPWGGRNYCETLLPENFMILVNNTKIQFTYKNPEMLLNDNEVYTRGSYSFDTSGDIIFSIEFEPNELKTLEVSYSTIHSSSDSAILYQILFSQNIKHSLDYKRRITIYNSTEDTYISKITTFRDNNPTGYNEKQILDIYNNYIDTSEIDFERKKSELVLNFQESDSARIFFCLTVFMNSCYPSQDYNFYSDSIVFSSTLNIYLSQSIIPKLNLYFLNNKQLQLLRNSFYALHGYSFKNPQLTEFYIENLSTYSELLNKGFDEKSFNDIEKKNLELIRELENMKEPLLLSEYLE